MSGWEHGGSVPMGVLVAAANAASGLSRWRAAVAVLVAAGAEGLRVSQVAAVLGWPDGRMGSMLCRCRETGHAFSLWVANVMYWYSTAQLRDEAAARLRAQGLVVHLESPMAEAAQARPRQQRLAPLLAAVADAGCLGIPTRDLCPVGDLTSEQVTRLMGAYRARGHVWSAWVDSQLRWYASLQWALEASDGGAAGVGVPEDVGPSPHRLAARRAREAREMARALKAARAMVPQPAVPPTPQQHELQRVCTGMAAPKREPAPQRGARGRLPVLVGALAVDAPVRMPAQAPRSDWLSKPAVNAGAVVPRVIPSPSVDLRYQVDAATFEGGEFTAAWRRARAGTGTAEA